MYRVCAAVAVAVAVAVAAALPPHTVAHKPTTHAPSCLDPTTVHHHSNVKEAVRWLTYTYLAVRMRQNPLVYAISYEQLAVRVVVGVDAWLWLWMCVFVDVARVTPGGSARPWVSRNQGFFQARTRRRSTNTTLRRVTLPRPQKRNRPTPS
jgi:hypothetical protein